MAKTRAQLISQSNNTFQDTPPANITPPNHRQFNEDVVDSTANLEDVNTFVEQNTFNSIVNFDSTINARIPSGDAIYVPNGNIFIETGNLDVGGQTNLNTTFVRVLQSAFKTIPFVISGTSNTLDLGGTDGNIIYIEGDGTINAFLGNIGTIFYAVFTGNAIFDSTSGELAPPTSFKMFPNDILIFVFTSSTTIRVVGRHRATDGVTNQLNGQNYYQINLPQDALDLQSQGLLDVGAVYRVKGAYTSNIRPILSWDVILTAKSTDLFAEMCQVVDESTSATHDAIFFGDFNQNSIVIYGFADSRSMFTYSELLANDNDAYFFGKGSKAFIDDLDLGYYGYANFDNLNTAPQRRNLQDLTDLNQMPFGSIFYVQSQNADKFISHVGDTSNGYFGTKWFDAVPANINLNTAIASLGSNTTINSYNCKYTIVNSLCTVYFSCEVDGKHQDGASGHELWALLPIPFSDWGGLGYGFGTCRNITNDNHEDIGLIVKSIAGYEDYFFISSKWSAATGTIATFTLNGTFIFTV